MIHCHLKSGDEYVTPAFHVVGSGFFSLGDPALTTCEGQMRIYTFDNVREPLFQVRPGLSRLVESLPGQELSLKILCSPELNQDSTQRPS
ncbi:hypothetical protein GN956_G13838 [Arapaima gigas]